jgi:hypothetical protein
MHRRDTAREARLHSVRPEQLPDHAPFELVVGEGKVWAAAERGAGGEPGGGPGQSWPPGDRRVGADVPGEDGYVGVSEAFEYQGSVQQAFDVVEVPGGPHRRGGIDVGVDGVEQDELLHQRAGRVQHPDCHRFGFDRPRDAVPGALAISDVTDSCSQGIAPPTEPSSRNTPSDNPRPPAWPAV